MKCLVLALALLASSSASAQTFLFAGHLDDGGAPASGSFTVDLAIVDDDGVIWSEQQSGVVVIDGNFAIDVGAAEPIDITVQRSHRLRITIEGDELPLAPLPFVDLARQVDTAEETGLASSAARIGGVTEDEAVTFARLTEPGQSVIPFTAITPVPAGVADGDDGADLSVDSTLTLSARTLSFNKVTGAKLAAGAVNSGRIADGAIGSVNVVDGAVTSQKVKNGSLTRADLAGDVEAAAVATIPVFLVTATNCKVSAGSLMTTATCQTPDCDLGGGLPGEEDCDTPGSCLIGSLVTCNNTPMGSLVQQ